MELKTQCHPEANGRAPLHGDSRWTIRLLLESGETLEVGMGKKSRDLLFGMLLADMKDSQEQEPNESLDLLWLFSSDDSLPSDVALAREVIRSYIARNRNG